MHWIAPYEKNIATDTLEKRLWTAADQLRSNSGLSAARYSQPVLGLIFLRFAEVRFAAQCLQLAKASVSSCRRSCVDESSAKLLSPKAVLIAFYRATIASALEMVSISIAVKLPLNKRKVTHESYS